jgi:hypothetical protein
MTDLPVRVISITHVPLVGSDLKITRWTRVTILVGDFGPFTKDFAQGQDTPDDINAWKLQQQQAIHTITI